MKNIKAYWVVGGALVLSVFISSSFAGSKLNCLIISLSVSNPVFFTDFPIGFSTDWCITPVSGCCLRADAKL